LLHVACDQLVLSAAYRQSITHQPTHTHTHPPLSAVAHLSASQTHCADRPLSDAVAMTTRHSALLIAVIADAEAIAASSASHVIHHHHHHHHII